MQKFNTEFDWFNFIIQSSIIHTLSSYLFCKKKKLNSFSLFIGYFGNSFYYFFLITITNTYHFLSFNVLHHISISSRFESNSASFFFCFLFLRVKVTSRAFSVAIARCWLHMCGFLKNTHSDVLQMEVSNHHIIIKNKPE